MTIRLPEVGDEVDGRIIEKLGDVAVITRNHHMLPVRMRDGKCELISISDYEGDRSRMRLWQTDNPHAREALDQASEIPEVRRGGSDQISIRGKVLKGEFSATFYYNEKKHADGYADQFAYC